jgi:hypothetical protein
MCDSENTNPHHRLGLFPIEQRPKICRGILGTRVKPLRWISAMTARVVALALLACSDLAARARTAVSTLPAGLEDLRLTAIRREIG